METVIKILFEKAIDPTEVDGLIDYLTVIKEDEINFFLQTLADYCRDHEECRTNFVKKEIITFVLDNLSDETETRALQSCRCIVNLCYYNEPAKEMMLEINKEKLKIISQIIKKYETLRLVGASAYANLFESCEKTQIELIDDDFVDAMKLCVDEFYTICIRTVNNLSVKERMNFVFKSEFFKQLLLKSPVDLADTDFSELMEYYLSVMSYIEFQSAFCQYGDKNIVVAYKKAIDIIVNPLFPKNVDEEDLNQTCMGIKLVLDVVNDYYKYPKTSILYNALIDTTIAYVLHGDIFSDKFIPAPTQNHCAEILCHMATVDGFLPKIWERCDEIMKLTFETLSNNKMMDYQKHCIGIIQSFSTNEEYSKVMLDKGILEKMSAMFVEEAMMNQPLIYRCLSVLQNFTVWSQKSDVLMNEKTIHIVVTTFKLMSNIVVRYSAVQVTRNIITSNANFIQMFNEDAISALIDVCLGKEEMQENEEKPDKRVRYEATRVLIKFLEHRSDILTTMQRSSDIYQCLLENLSTDFAVLNQEVVEILVKLMKKGIEIPQTFHQSVKPLLQSKLQQIITSPPENQQLNKVLVDLMEEYLNLLN